MAGSTGELRPLSRLETSYQDAAESEQDMVQKLGHRRQRDLFANHFFQRRPQLEALIAAHLGLGHGESCHVPHANDWFHGTFNLCIPVELHSTRPGPLPARLLLRLPLPHKVGDVAFPGNAEEKVRCEAATYVWIGRHCPDVPIPRLWGFSLTGKDMVCLDRAERLSTAG